MLRPRSGPAIAGYLSMTSVGRGDAHPDGRLWIDRLTSGLETRPAHRAGRRRADRRLVAHHVGAEVHAGSPRVSAELPEAAEPVRGLVPPVVTAPCFAIRRPAIAVFTLGDYVDAASCRRHRPSCCGRRHERKNVPRPPAAPRRARPRWSMPSRRDRQDRRPRLLIEIPQAGNARAEPRGSAHQGTAPPRSPTSCAPRCGCVPRIPIGEVRGAEALDLLKGLGHRPSRRPRDPPCRLPIGGAAAAGAAHPGGVMTVPRRSSPRRSTSSPCSRAAVGATSGELAVSRLGPPRLRPNPAGEHDAHPSQSATISQRPMPHPSPRSPRRSMPRVEHAA